jgi:hypothetical protein
MHNPIFTFESSIQSLNGVICFIQTHEDCAGRPRVRRHVSVLQKGIINQPASARRKQICVLKRIRKDKRTRSFAYKDDHDITLTRAIQARDEQPVRFAALGSERKGQNKNT